MNDEYLNHEATRQLLNRSLGKLSPSTLAGLRAARERALARHAPEKQGSVWLLSRRRAAVFATLLVSLSLFGGIAYYWQQMNDNTDVDMAILTDDKPIDTYAN